MHLSRRTAILVATIALFLGGFALASCGGGGGSETAAGTETETTSITTTTASTGYGPRIVRVVVLNGAPKGGIVRESIDKGDRVVLVVISDVSDEVHLHGYDISRDVPAGGTVRISFTADLPGRFEVELEGRGAQIGELTVRP